MKKDGKASVGCRLFVPFDEHTDLGLVLPVMCSDKKVHRLNLNVMIHQGSDSDGVILWFFGDEE